MRFLVTADWNVGKKLSRTVSLLNDQKLAIEEVAALASKHAADVIFVIGPLVCMPHTQPEAFDTALSAFRALSDNGRRVVVVVPAKRESKELLGALDNLPYVFVAGRTPEQTVELGSYTFTWGVKWLAAVDKSGKKQFDFLFASGGADPSSVAKDVLRQKKKISTFPVLVTSRPPERPFTEEVFAAFSAVVMPSDGETAPTKSKSIVEATSPVACKPSEEIMPSFVALAEWKDAKEIVAKRHFLKTGKPFLSRSFSSLAEAVKKITAMPAAWLQIRVEIQPDDNLRSKKVLQSYPWLVSAEYAVAEKVSAEEDSSEQITQRLFREYFTILHGYEPTDMHLEVVRGALEWRREQSAKRQQQREGKENATVVELSGGRE